MIYERISPHVSPTRRACAQAPVPRWRESVGGSGPPRAYGFTHRAGRAYTLLAVRPAQARVTMGRTAARRARRHPSRARTGYEFGIVERLGMPKPVPRKRRLRSAGLPKRLTRPVAHRRDGELPKPVQFAQHALFHERVRNGLHGILVKL